MAKECLFRIFSNFSGLTNKSPCKYSRSHRSKKSNKSFCFINHACLWPWRVSIRAIRTSRRLCNISTSQELPTCHQPTSFHRERLSGLPWAFPHVKLKEPRTRERGGHDASVMEGRSRLRIDPRVFTCMDWTLRNPASRCKE